MPHGGSAMGTVPRVLNLPHVDQELPHLADTQGSADHHLWISMSQLTLSYKNTRNYSLLFYFLEEAISYITQ